MPRRKPKKFQAKRKVPKPYKSWLEYNLAKSSLSKLVYEPETLSYDIVLLDKRYTPDFMCNGYCLEIKGVFTDRNEANKYLHIRDSGHDIRFIFQNPNASLPWAKKRKNGSRMSHAEWAEKNDFEYCSADNIPKDWIT